MPGLVFHNEVRSAGRRSGDNAYIFGAPYSYIRYVRGTIPIGNSLFTIKGAIPDPPFFAAYHLTQKLEDSGVECMKKAITYLQLEQANKTSNLERASIHEHFSPPLKEIVVRTNQKSINLYCESMLRSIGVKKMKKGSTSAGIRAVKAHWEDRGLSFDGCDLKDGSGLSPRNLVTAKFMAQFMRKVARDPNIYSSFKASLPLAGRSGILRNKFKKTIAEKKIWAKSGTLGNVRTYVGYFKNQKGVEYSFCILVNNYEGSGGAIRRKMEQMMLEFCK